MTQVTEVDGAQRQVSEMQNTIDLYESQITELILRIDDAGWSKIAGMDGTGVELSALKKMTGDHYDIVAANPIIGRAVRVRSAYVWGQGLELIAAGGQDVGKNVISAIKKNSTIFKRSQNMQLETTATATGNVFFLIRGRGRNGTIKTIPLEQITGAIYESDPIDGVKLYIREWTTETNGKETRHKKAYLHRYARYSGSTVRVNNEDIEVGSNDERIVHVKFNAPEEWTFGVPDLFGANFWAQAYKTAMESDLKLKDALARFAWKVTASTKPSARAAATATATTPGVGGTAGMTEGANLTAINKSGSQVNFNDNWPIASIIAAGFDVPLDELLYQTGSTSTDTLSETNAYVLSMRQEIWCEAIETCFDLLGVQINAITPHLFSEPVHRVAQAISVLANTNLLHPEELREASVLQMKRYGVQTFKDTLPEAGAWAEYAQGLSNNPGTSPLNTPDNTRSPAGPLADDDNELRDEDPAQS